MRNPLQVYLALIMFILTLIAMMMVFMLMASGGMNWGV